MRTLKQKPQQPIHANAIRDDLRDEIQHIKKELSDLLALDTDVLIRQRVDKYRTMGRFQQAEAAAVVESK